MQEQPLSRELVLQIDKGIFDAQARQLLATNYVYNQNVKYDTELVKAFPDEKSVPECFLACAKFIPVATDGEDVIRADGPACSTTGDKR